MSALPQGATWVRFPRFVGDAAMQMPVLRLLRVAGTGPLVVWGPRAAVSLVENTDLCDGVLFDEGKPGVLAMARTLRGHHAARSVHFPKSLRPALASFLARVPERIGVDESLAGLFNTVSGPFWKAEGPFLLRYGAVLKKAFPDAGPMPFADYDPGIAINAPRERYLCLMPGSTWTSKSWPSAHFRQLVLRARGEGFAVVMLGSPDEAKLCAEVAGEEAMDLAGKTSLKEAAAWLRGASGAIGNDSGLSHLAAACGTPVLALYGATDPGGSAPWGPKVRILRREGVPCAPCFKPICAVEGHPCLDGLAPEEVWSAFLELLRQ
ncbi:MAG TPA: glycosyltransferase family 9 protein [Holophagaceae bacterium]|jgi:heptosyltransferase-2|nr:glycosyltransferase family 9 protein [Holophagaceae bacterium]